MVSSLLGSLLTSLNCSSPIPSLFNHVFPLISLIIILIKIYPPLSSSFSIPLWVGSITKIIVSFFNFIDS